MNTKETAELTTEIVLFRFKKLPVRSTVIDGESWLAAKDVCDILGIVNTTQAVEDFPEDEILKLSNREFQDAKNGSWGGVRSLLFVNEPGVYRLIFQSRKPEAERLKRFVFHEVLPALRKTGSYTMPKRKPPTPQQGDPNAELQSFGNFLNMHGFGGMNGGKGIQFSTISKDGEEKLISAQAQKQLDIPPEEVEDDD